jgi:hypothetical protein
VPLHTGHLYSVILEIMVGIADGSKRLSYELLIDGCELQLLFGANANLALRIVFGPLR